MNYVFLTPTLMEKENARKHTLEQLHERRKQVVRLHKKALASAPSLTNALSNSRWISFFGAGLLSTALKLSCSICPATAHNSTLRSGSTRT
jgi:hypothetical protein